MVTAARRRRRSGTVRYSETGGGGIAEAAPAVVECALAQASRSTLAERAWWREAAASAVSLSGR